MGMIVKYLIKNPKTKITIVGYADDLGKSQVNAVIAKKRALSVKNYLVQKLNIDPQRLNIKVAETLKSTVNHTGEGVKNNNSVTINECP